MFAMVLAMVLVSALPYDFELEVWHCHEVGERAEDPRTRYRWPEAGEEFQLIFRNRREAGAMAQGQRGEDVTCVQNGQRTVCQTEDGLLVVWLEPWGEAHWTDFRTPYQGGAVCRLRP